VWSITQKITYEAEGGVKKLTLQGRILIGMTVAATFISLLSMGIGLIVDRQNAQKAADEQRDKKAEERAREARAAAEREKIAREKQADTLRQIQADAQLQRGIIGQRLLTIANEARQQRRDAQISRQIAVEANKRLAEAGRALAEFRRINYPLRSVTVRVTLALDFGGTDIEYFWKRIDSDDSIAWGPRLSDRYGPRVVADLDPRQFISNAEPVHYATRGTRIALAFVVPGGALPLSPGGASDEITPIEPPEKATGSNEIRVPVGYLELESVRVDRGKRTMTAFFSHTYKPPVEGVIASGDKLSLSDVNQLVPILTIERSGMSSVARRPPDTLVEVSYSLNEVDRFRANPGFRISGKAAFTLVPKPLPE
jgi:hypothetical protein